MKFNSLRLNLPFFSFVSSAIQRLITFFIVTTLAA